MIAATNSSAVSEPCYQIEVGPICNARTVFVRRRYRHLHQLRAGDEEVSLQTPHYPSLYQVNIRVWLTELSQTLDRTATLDDIPDIELESGGCRTRRPGPLPNIPHGPSRV